MMHVYKHVSIAYDPKRTRSDGACEVCHVGRCGMLGECTHSVYLTISIDIGVRRLSGTAVAYTTEFCTSHIYVSDVRGKIYKDWISI